MRKLKKKTKKNMLKISRARVGIKKVWKNIHPKRINQSKKYSKIYNNVIKCKENIH